MMVAIYTRKSKSTDKGESICTQMKLCEEYIKKQYPEEQTKMMYYDEGEGKSGGDRQRVKFQELMRDAKKKKFEVLICYRLDRVARSVADFSDLIEELNQHRISFISVKEQFDTSTPMGRAMMYIASVFAQLEREIGAERVRDNLRELAKSGRWLGGTTPTGYCSEGFEVLSLKEMNEKQEVERKRKKVYKLQKIEEEWEILEILFQKMEELESLTAVESYLYNHNIRTKNQKRYTRYTLLTIYRNMVYAKNDLDMYQYLKEKNIEIYAKKEQFDGKKGMMAYNKTFQQKHKAAVKNDMQDWIVSIGKHEGILEGKRWIHIQNILDRNQCKRYRRPRKNKALLSGILTCQCKGVMRPKMVAGRTDTFGKDRFFYMCEIKEVSRRYKCNGKNVDGNELDRQLLNEMKTWFAPNSKVVEQLKKLDNKKEAIEDLEIERLRKWYAKNEKEVIHLIDRMKYMDFDFIQDVNQEIKRIKEKNQQIKEQIKELSQKQQNDKLEITENEIEIFVQKILNDFFNVFTQLDIMKQRSLIKMFISTAVWNGEDVDMTLFF